MECIRHNYLCPMRFGRPSGFSIPFDTVFQCINIKLFRMYSFNHIYQMCDLKNTGKICNFLQFNEQYPFGHHQVFYYHICSCFSFNAFYCSVYVIYICIDFKSYFQGFFSTMMHTAVHLHSFSDQPYFILSPNMGTSEQMPANCNPRRAPLRTDKFLVVIGSDSLKDLRTATKLNLPSVH